MCSVSRSLLQHHTRVAAANLRTKILDFRGSDASRISQV